MQPVPDNIPTLDGYTYVSTLGRGGFADVHLYQQRFPRRKVAIKVLRVEELDTALRRQFVSEANVMARLSSHPAIATIFAADITAEGDPYLVMEYYARGSLGTGYRDAPLSIEDVLRHGVRIATALEHAHRGGVVCTTM
jgi:serine/threonine protein kinase